MALGQPFAHETYLNDLTALRDELKSGLSGRQDECKPDHGPTAAKLAARIKLLKAENTIEASAPRGEHNRVAAEDPVTTRILRRQEEAVANEGHPQAAEPQSEQIPPETQSFANRILRERQFNSEGEGQSPP